MDTTKGADMQVAPNMNREAWLTTLAAELEPAFAAIEFPVTRAYRVTCGFPSSRARSATKKAIGECWTTGASEDDANEIFISPVLVDPMEVAAVLAHELVHAVDNCEHGHKGPFVRAIRALGLAGKPTATVAGEAFLELASPIVEKLGPYPHGRLSVNVDAKRKQSTRMLKVACPDCAEEGEPFLVRMSRTTLDRGAPICPIHDTPMEESA